jgi:hypothetical protein
MSRRRVILGLLLCTAVSAAVAVQHDTFLRRWLVPPPLPRPLLDKVVPHIQFKQTADERPLEHLANVAGLCIVLPDGSGTLRAISDSYAGATADFILWELALSTTLSRLVPYEYGGVICFREPDEALTVARSYDLKDLLPSADAVAPDGKGKPGSARAYSIALFRQVFRLVNTSQNSEISLFGTTLVVTGNEVDQRTARVLLEFFRRDEKAREGMQTGSNP